MRFGKGLHRTPPERVAHRLGAHLLVTAGVPPKGSAQLQACPRMDQGNSGTCHAHSAAGAIWTACNAKGRPLGWVPSPLEIASTTYASVRSRMFPSGPLPPLQDTGAELQDDAQAMATWGICPMLPQVGGRFSDVPDDTAGPFPEPTVSELAVAGADLISGEYQVLVNDDAPQTIALCLDACVPIWVGFFCDTAFERLGPNDVAQVPDDGDPHGGGHAVYLSGYRTASDGYEFCLENSWGTNWANNGSVWVSSGWVKACWNLWPMAVCP